MTTEAINLVKCDLQTYSNLCTGLTNCARKSFKQFGNSQAFSSQRHHHRATPTNDAPFTDYEGYTGTKHMTVV